MSIGTSVDTPMALYWKRRMFHKREKRKVQRFDYYINGGEKQLFVREILPQHASSNTYVLFVHGLLFPSIPQFDQSWSEHSITEYLAQRNINCCIFDLRGYGKSDKPERGKSISVKEWIEDLSVIYTFLLFNRGAKKIALAGVDMGCSLIAHALQSSDINPFALAFFSPLYQKSDFFRRLVCLPKGFDVLQNMFNQKASKTQFREKRLNRAINGENYLIEEGAVANAIQTAIELSHPGSSRLSIPSSEILNSYCKKNISQELFSSKALKNPMLIMRGEYDQICTKESADALMRDVSKGNNQAKLATFEKLKQYHHLYKNHDDVFETMYSFIKSQKVQ